LLSSLTIVNNLGYQKYYRPELLLPIIQENSEAPVLIAATHESLVQTGEMMGIAWQLQQQTEKKYKTNFLLVSKTAKKPEQANKKLQKIVANLPRPLDVWTVNFNAEVALNLIPKIILNHCQLDSKNYPYIDGYTYKRYQCR
jgi:uncharacterized membrane protein